MSRALKQRQREQEAGKRWFLSLDDARRNQLGDDFVLGCFDWRDWGFDEKPSAAFLNAAERERVFWEISES